MIVGIDEVGRGAWAGPLVVGAVGLGGVTIDGLTDSKLLSKKKREKLALQIKQSAPRVGIGWVSAVDIDAIGLSQALKLAARRALQQIECQDIEQIIIDGTIPLLDDPRVTLMKKADLLVPSVSAASIVAKVARDAYMSLCDTVFSGYGFSGHVGYGAEKHRAAIESLGVLPIHRRSFAPIANHVSANGNNSHMKKHVSNVTTSVSAGNKGEDVASEYLVRHGYSIVDRNWKTKWCEVDIIARKNNRMYFVEVKYRRSQQQGGGVAAITYRKKRQMKFAAEFWLHTQTLMDASLAVLEVSGDAFEVTYFVDDIT
jgi:ribonuclease HII